MKPSFVSMEFTPSKLTDLDHERVARLGGEMLTKLATETSGPAEALAALRVAARLIREVMNSMGVDAEAQQEVLQQSDEIAQGIRSMILDAKDMPFGAGMSPGGNA